jgi:hypothetical protein
LDQYSDAALTVGIAKGNDQRRDRVKMFLFIWGRLVACGGLVTRLERRLPTGAQLDKLPHG